MIHHYKNKTPITGNNCFVAPSADLIGEVTMGNDCSVWFGCVVRADVHYIKIGDRVNIQDLSMIHVTHYKNPDRSDGNPTIIEDDVTIGHRVMLHGCTIKKASLIGMSATILDGAVIGEESIVGAGSLVTKNKIFPPRSLIMGTPAKFIRELTEEEIKELYNSAKRYVIFKNEYL
jgi:carbonic anhydrase/acetyltransferase-like protein (isoleucine patch superfamily)